MERICWKYFCRSKKNVFFFLEQLWTLQLWCFCSVKALIKAWFTTEYSSVNSVPLRGWSQHRDTGGVFIRAERSAREESLWCRCSVSQCSQKKTFSHTHTQRERSLTVRSKNPEREEPDGPFQTWWTCFHFYSLKLQYPDKVTTILNLDLSQ